MTMRLFVGIRIPGEILDRICAAARELEDPNLKVIPRENLHLTLAFLGEYDPGKAKDKLGKLKFEGGSLGFKGCGVFPGRDFARIVWIGVVGEGMKRNADAIMKEFGINENRETTLHLTIARVYGKTEKTESFLEKYRETDFGSFRPESICLYQSILRKPNPEYRMMDRFLLPA